MILASASPRRLELLRECGFQVTVHPADIDETPQVGEFPVELVRRLAIEKAHAAARELGILDDILIAADTIVWNDSGDALGKPKDSQDARRMLRLLSGETHSVTTGVCIMMPTVSGLRERAFVETTSVMFHNLTDEQIEAYVASGEPMDKAGAYGIQGLGRVLVRLIRGDYPNVVGLPVSRLVREIEQLEESGTFVTQVLGGNHA